MVDFNNDVTIGIPASNIEKVSILQRRYDLIEAYEDYKKRSFAGGDIGLHFVRSRLISLFLEIQAMLKRRLTPGEYERVEFVCFNGKEEKDLLGVIKRINEELDKIHLTLIDNQKIYDSTNVESENKIKGY